MKFEVSLLGVLFLPLLFQGLLTLFRLPKLILLLPGLMALLGMLVLFLPVSEQPLSHSIVWFFAGKDSPWSIVLVLDNDGILFAFLSAAFSLLIQWYSLAYLKPTDSQRYFHFLIRIFQTAMAWLFLSRNFMSLFLAWEWIGLSSYLLVQFWYGKQEPVKAGLRVLLINKTGDVFLLAALGALVSFGLHHVVFGVGIFPPGSEIFLHSRSGTILLLFLLTAALVKSAQFPFSVWLKDAMQGPTSVSALLHSATMVLAGIWLITRLEPWLSPEVHRFLLIIGFLTFFLSAFAAMLSVRIKELLAFSTVSQLALMLIACGLGMPQLALFHGFTHAFFKAALFLFAGWLMHEAGYLYAGKDSQDFRNWRSILANSPWKWPFLVCLAALSGLPLTSGFVSKESLLPDVWSGNADQFDFVIYVALQACALLTAFYCFRLFFWLALPVVNFKVKLNSPGFAMGIPVILLSLGSGFWLVGVNPLSSQGWIQYMLGFEGNSLHPDFWAALLGVFLAWRWIKNNSSSSWPYVEKPWQLASRWEFFPSLADRMGAISLLFSQRLLWLEEKVMDLPPRRLADGFLVAGYFSSFVDRWILDPLLHGVVYLIHTVGDLVKESTRKYPQYVVWFSITFLFVLIYFAYRS